MERLLEQLDRVPVWMCVALVVALGLAPFTPEPHIWEKLKMIAAGTLWAPLDIFDLLWHLWPWLLLIAKLLRIQGLLGGR